LVTLVSGPVLAEPTSADKAMATQLFDDADKDMSRSNYAAACSKYGESQRLDPQLGTLLHLADCYEKAGKTASAWATFKDAIEIAARKNAAGANESREKIARSRAAALEARLSKLTLLVAGGDAAGLEVQQDGQLVGRATWGSALPVDPGSHTLVAKAPGKKTWTKTVEVGANGAKIEVAVPALEPDVAARATPSSPPAADAATPALRAGSPEAPSTGGSSQRAVGYAIGGAGVVGVAIGTAFFLKRGSTVSERDGLCPGDVCKDAAEASRVADLTDQAKHEATASIIAFASGGVALVAGGVLLLTATSTESAKPGAALRILPWASATSAGAAMTGRW
jgi:serine/threonine-protein kinase